MHEAWERCIAVGWRFCHAANCGCGGCLHWVVGCPHNFGPQRRVATEVMALILAVLDEVRSRPSARLAFALPPAGPASAFSCAGRRDGPRQAPQRSQQAEYFGGPGGGSQNLKVAIGQARRRPSFRENKFFRRVENYGQKAWKTAVDSRRHPRR